jgi:Sulfotransferase domain
MSGTTRRVAQQVRERMPDRAVDAVRHGQELWGTATAGVRMTPSFLVVGAQRCGTTTLYRVLSDHPDVVRPTMSKGIGYFDLNYERGPRWYRGHFPLSAAHERRGRVAFESSGYYCYHPLAASRIARDLPDVRVVMMVRDPVERAQSAYKHESARGFEELSFEEAVDAEPARLEGEVERMLADPTYQSWEHRHHSYVTRGRYAEQVERLHSELGAERVHLVDADRFFADPRREFSQLTDWLGLRPWVPPSVPQANARPGDLLSESLRRRLREMFTESDERLAAQLGRQPSWRS